MCHQFTKRSRRRLSLISLPQVLFNQSLPLTMWDQQLPPMLHQRFTTSHLVAIMWLQKQPMPLQHITSQEPPLLLPQELQHMVTMPTSQLPKSVLQLYIIQLMVPIPQEVATAINIKDILLATAHQQVNKQPYQDLVTIKRLLLWEESLIYQSESCAVMMLNADPTAADKSHWPTKLPRRLSTTLNIDRDQLQRLV